MTHQNHLIEFNTNADIKGITFNCITSNRKSGLAVASSAPRGGHEIWP